MTEGFCERWNRRTEKMHVDLTCISLLLSARDKEAHRLKREYERKWAKEDAERKELAHD